MLCRNVMIYFNRGLQERTHTCFTTAWRCSAVLGLGSRESLRFMPHEHLYEPLVAGEKLYRRIA
jgi:chemotaxis protein methyltransferase CheR